MTGQRNSHILRQRAQKLRMWRLLLLAILLALQLACVNVAPGGAPLSGERLFDRVERYADFGWAAARLDDLVNLIPARLTGALIAAAATGVRRTAFRTMLRDASRHRSPNAGWPEAAMAGALAVRLSGPRMYDGVPTDDPYLNPVAGDPRPQDIARGLRLYQRAVAFFALALFLAALT